MPAILEIVLKLLPDMVDVLDANFINVKTVVNIALIFSTIVIKSNDSNSVKRNENSCIQDGGNELPFCHG